MMSNPKKIVLTNLCNNSCLFCNSHSSERFSLDFKQFSHDFNDVELANVKDGIVLTGGEPTLHPEFFDFLNYFVEMGKNVVIETNARAFSLDSFMERLGDFDNSKVAFDVLLVSHIAELHNYLTQTKSFFQTVNGIRNLMNAGFTVKSHTVVVKPNYRYLLNIARLVKAFGISEHRFIFVQPQANANKYFDSMIPFMSMVEPYLKVAVNFLESKGVNVILENFVPCLASGREDIIEKYADAVRLDACESCEFSSCSGAPKWYVELKDTNDFLRKND